MRFLVVTQYFFPEPGAPSNRLQAFVDAMLERGHEVTVICEFPNYPSGRLAREDRGRLFRIEKKGSLKIIRTFVLTFARKNNVKRMLFYLSFALSSFVAALILRRRDVILASSPPIFHVYMATLAAWLKRSRLVVDIRDIWPDTVVEFEAIRAGRLMRWGGKIERGIYDKADLIFCISNGMREKVAVRGGDNKIRIIYNGSSEDMLSWAGDRQAVRRALGWDGKLVVAYMGVIGLGQDLSALLPEIAGSHLDDTFFVFIGDGPGKEALIREKDRLGTDSVIIMAPSPRSKVVEYTHAADIMLVILRESDFFMSAIPSKFFDGMAAGKPVVSNVDGELREIMERNNAGLYFSLREKGSFRKAIQSLGADSGLRQRMGENGRSLTRERFLRSEISREAIKEVEHRFGSEDHPVRPGN